MDIKVLGPGCKKCEKLYNLTNEVLSELEREANITKVTEFKDIASYGVMKTPALVIDEEVKFSGRVPSKKDLMKLLK